MSSRAKLELNNSPFQLKNDIGILLPSTPKTKKLK